MKNFIGIIIIVLLLASAGIYVFEHTYYERNQSAGYTASVAPVPFLCAANKTLTATYGDINVSLTLSDGRTIVLPHALSGSGFRYASTTPDIAFVGKGDDAYLEEGGITTYDNCVANAAPASSTAATNSTSSYTFSDNGKTLRFNYPKEVSVSGGGIGYSTAWQNEATTSGLVLAIATLPRSFQPNSNFGEAKLTVGTSADPNAVSSCSIGPVALGIIKSTVTINGVPYAKITYSDVGAGNIYDTTSYRTVRNGQCYTIEYTIHSSNIGNYDPAQSITAYDKAAVTNVMESMVQSVTFL